MTKRGALPILFVLAASFFFANCKNASGPDYERSESRVAVFNAESQ